MIQTVKNGMFETIFCFLYAQLCEFRISYSFSIKHKINKFINVYTQRDECVCACIETTHDVLLFKNFDELCLDLCVNV